MESLDQELVSAIDTFSPLETVISSPPSEASYCAYPSIWQSFGILFIMIFVMIGCAPLFMLTGRLSSEVAMMLYYITAMGLTLFIVHSIRKRKSGQSIYNFRIDSWKLIFPLIVVSVALLLGVIGPITSLIPMPEEANESIQKMASQTGFATFVFFVIAAPVLEELIFRGIMLDGLLQRYRPLTAIFVSSLLFGLAHLNPWQFVTGLVLGCFLGWVYYRTRSVGPCIVVHMAANLCGYLIRLVYDFSGNTQQANLTDSSASIEQYFVFSSICLLMILVAVVYLRQQFDRLAGASQAGSTLA